MGASVPRRRSSKSVARFAGYVQLHKFTGGVSSDPAKVYGHLDSEDVNRSIRDKYGLDTAQDDDQSVDAADREPPSTQ
jgi:hypothetical protein